MTDIEDIAVAKEDDYIEVDDIGDQNIRSEMSDFQIACDLLGDFIEDEEKEITDVDPLKFVPDSVAEFKALRKSINPFVEKLSSEEKLLFLENFLSRATKNIPHFIIDDITKCIK
jgi:hypothetical protein